MSLTRKPGFYREWDLVVVRAFPPVTINGYPESDYQHLRPTQHGWLGASVRDLSRIVDIERAPNMKISDFESLVHIRHLNIARFFGLYYNRRATEIVIEHVDLDLFDVCPLSSEAEIASVVAQILSAMTYLLSLPTDTRILTVRLSMFGVVKLVIDFHQPPTTDVIHRKNMYRFMVSYVEQVMRTLSCRDHIWTFDAADFLDILYSGELPALIHPFLDKSRGPAGSRKPAQLCMRRLLAKGANRTQ